MCHPLMLWDDSRNGDVIVKTTVNAFLTAASSGDADTVGRIHAAHPELFKNPIEYTPVGELERQMMLRCLNFAKVPERVLTLN